MVCFVLAVEHVGFKFTMLVGIAIEIPFALGEAVLGVEAVLVRNWRDLQVLIFVARIFGSDRSSGSHSVCLSVCDNVEFFTESLSNFSAVLKRS